MSTKLTPQFPKIPVPLMLAGGIAGLLLASVPIANHVADRREQPVQETIAAFSKKLPAQPANRSAMELTRFASQLGIQLPHDLVHTRLQQQPQPNQPTPASLPSPVPASPAVAQTPHKAIFEQVQATLQEFLDKQLEKPDETIVAIPTGDLKNYLAMNRSTLEWLQLAVRQQDIPRWRSDPAWITQKLDNANVSPEFWQIAHLQRVLLVETLEQHRQGNQQAALNLLEASWKINQSLRDRPEWDAHRTGMVVNSLQLGVLRKLGNLPSIWQQRLKEYDYHQSVLTALQGKAITGFTYERSLFHPSSGFQNSEQTTETHQPLQPMGFLGNPYARLVAIDRFQTRQQWLKVFSTPSDCSLKQLDLASYPAKLFATSEVEGVSASLKQATGHRLMMEMTEQVLQIKANAIETGALPASLPDQPSAICTGARWQYQLSNGTATLSLQSAPAWLASTMKEAQKMGIGTSEWKNLHLSHQFSPPPPTPAKSPYQYFDF